MSTGPRYCQRSTAASTHLPFGLLMLTITQQRTTTCATWGHFGILWMDDLSVRPHARDGRINPGHYVESSLVLSRELSLTRGLRPSGSGFAGNASTSAAQVTNGSTLGLTVYRYRYRILQLPHPSSPSPKSHTAPPRVTTTYQSRVPVSPPSPHHRPPHSSRRSKSQKTPHLHFPPRPNHIHDPHPHPPPPSHPASTRSLTFRPPALASDCSDTPSHASSTPSNSSQHARHRTYISA